ncbi:MAG TPA: hydantoinase B/oxoprolinase family protein [Thermodesulfobacteriota bacterium]
MSSRPDPITVSVLWNSLLSIAEEMGSTIRRTAYSEAVREGDDFSTGLFDRRGRLVAQGNYSPGHLGSMPYVVRNALRYVDAGTLRPGDAILVNDPVLGSGHMPDCFMISPAFVGAELVGFAVNIAHHVDVGGAAPGSQKIGGITEAFQEGLRILPIRIVKEGTFDEDLLRLILGNVRLPEKMECDLRAQRNANFVGTRRLAQLYESLGHDVVEQGIEDILERSTREMREVLRRIPDGTWSFDDRLDDFGPGTSPIEVAVDVTVRDGTITVDLSRSSDQVNAGLNSYINYTRAYASFAVRVMAGVRIPQNEGTLPFVSVVAREGSFFNPVFPAPSGGRAAVQIRIFEAVAGALSRAIPHRAMAAFSHWSNPNIGGVDDRTGKRFVMYDVVLGGYGARADSDGVEALCPVFNCANIPVEVHEIANPVLIRKLAFVPDSGGSGRFRGGCGLEKEIELLASSATCTLAGDRHVTAPYGIEGGKPGALAMTVLVTDGREQALGSKDCVPMKRGDVLRIRLCGGGGYGDPLSRERSAIVDDLIDGFITPTGAARDYGVDAGALLGQ